MSWKFLVLLTIHTLITISLWTAALFDLPGILPAKQRAASLPPLERVLSVPDQRLGARGRVAAKEDGGSL